jgi:hypothetical protein
MISEREKESSGILRYAKISPKEKLEWLWQMHEFTRKFSSKQSRELFWRLRGIK